MGASKKGEPGIRMRRMKKENDELLVQCLLGGKAVSRQTAKNPFENKDSLLSPVASIVRSMGSSSMESPKFSISSTINFLDPNPVQSTIRHEEQARKAPSILANGTLER
jgi:hypothetical protein